MKYKTFIRIRTTILAVLSFGTVGTCNYLNTYQEQEPYVDVSAIAYQEVQTYKQESLASEVPEKLGLSLEEEPTSLQKLVMRIRASVPISAGHHDPNSGGLKYYMQISTFCIDLRCDKRQGYNYWNRVKIDWDKDKKWDEKWTFNEKGVVKRVCSVEDNEDYGITQRMRNNRWFNEGEELPEISTESAPIARAATPSLNYKLDLTGEITAAHKVFIQLQKNTPLSAGKHDPNNNGVKKFFKKTNYNADLRCDKAKGFNYFNRLKIDWDKDKKWDEKWFFRKNGVIKRECSSKDNNKYDLVFESKGNKWVKKK